MWRLFWDLVTWGTLHQQHLYPLLETSWKHICLTHFHASFYVYFKNRTECKISTSLCCSQALQASPFLCDWVMLRLNDLWESGGFLFFFFIFLRLPQIAAVWAKHTKRRLKLWLCVNKSPVSHLGQCASVHLRQLCVLWGLCKRVSLAQDQKLERAALLRWATILTMFSAPQDVCFWRVADCV